MHERQQHCKYKLTIQVDQDVKQSESKQPVAGDSVDADEFMASHTVIQYRKCLESRV